MINSSIFRTRFSCIIQRTFNGFILLVSADNSNVVGFYFLLGLSHNVNQADIWLHYREEIKRFHFVQIGRQMAMLLGFFHWVCQTMSIVDNTAKHKSLTLISGFLLYLYWSLDTGTASSENVNSTSAYITIAMMII